MKSNYKRLGDYIRPYNQLNDNMEIEELLGISNNKYFQKSHTNTIGIDLSTYRVVRTNQFAYNRATTRNGDKISIALRDGNDCIVSPSYRIFESKDENTLNSEYLMMWFRRPEFDRYVRFKSHGSAHEFFEYDEMCEVMLPVPSIEKQREIVKEYNVIVDRINLNNRLIQKLEETAQAIYKQWFVDFEFPNENGKPYKSNGGEMIESELGEIPNGWNIKPLEDLISIKHGFAFKGENIIEEENQNILLTPGNFRIGGGFKSSNFKYYNGDFPKDYIFKTGDLMVTMTDLSKEADTIGYPAIIPEIKGKSLLHNQRLGRVIFKHNLKFFIYWLMRSSSYRQSILGSIIGTTVKHTSPSKIIEYKFPFCNDELLLNKFENLSEKIQSLISQMTIENDKINALKNIILSKLATITN